MAEKSLDNQLKEAEIAKLKQETALIPQAGQREMVHRQVVS